MVALDFVERSFAKGLILALNERTQIIRNPESVERLGSPVPTDIFDRFELNGQQMVA
jgi:hypothetical protein